MISLCPNKVLLVEGNNKILEELSGISGNIFLEDGFLLFFNNKNPLRTSKATEIITEKKFITVVTKNSRYKFKVLSI